MSLNWKTVLSLDTEYPADSIEWCPIKPYLEYFICGTYFLLESKDAVEETTKLAQERIGTILLLKIGCQSIELVQKTESNGVLDIKWCPYICEEKIIVGVVTAKGDVNIFIFDEDKLTFLCGLNLKTEEEEGDYMTLALNWYKESSDEAKICVTDNRGNAAVLKYCCGKLCVSNKWEAHSLEAWTVSFDANDDNILYTGGDDAKLKIWDRRGSEIAQRLVNKHQNTGVTIIQTETGLEHIILVGSFDEVLKIWDTRHFKVPVNEVKCSGGIWRAKCQQNFVLTANIYGGFQIADFANEAKVVADYRAHDSLAYGADFSFMEGNHVSKLFNVNNTSVLLGTCSFYDHLLTISIWDPEQLP